MNEAAYDDDVSWLDEPPVVKPITPGPSADPNSGRQKMLLRRNQIDARKKREGIGNRRSLHRRTMTPDNWKKAIELAANGLKRKDMIKALHITPETFEAYMIANVGASKQLRDADLIWLRRCWPLDAVERLLNRVALGETVKKAASELGYSEERVGTFISLMRRDRQMREFYDDARQLQAESFIDDNIDISDGDGKDTYEDAKGNVKLIHGIVQRDALRVSTRQWTMGVLHRKRFGDHKTLEHGGEIQVNHAVQLSKARKRLENAHKPAIIDNETQAVIEE